MAEELTHEEIDAFLVAINNGDYIESNQPQFYGSPGINNWKLKSMIL